MEGSQVRRFARVAIAIVGAGLLAHLLAGAVGLPERIPVPIGFVSVEHYPEPGRDPALAYLVGLLMVVALLLSVTHRGIERVMAFEGVALLAVGGAMNLGEEALRGSVRDYFLLLHPEHRVGIVFNVADLALLFGFLALARLPVRAAGELLGSLRRR
jgi:hypothetical protein